MRDPERHGALAGSAVDTFAFGTLVVLTGLFAVYCVDFRIPPFEDAAMLLRYAGHLAEGKGIVWNVGEAPLDGATDFLFMTLIAIAHHVGLTVETAARLIAILSHFATLGIIYFGMRRLQNAGPIPAFVTAAWFAAGPGLFLSALCFGAPFFALTVAVAWLLAQRLFLPGGATVRAQVAFSVACLVAGLARPEGVLISVFILAAAGVLMPRREFSRLAFVFAGIFLALGGAYFLWRWEYFGHSLPNPFYKKGGGQLHIEGLIDSLYKSLSFTQPFIPAFLLAVHSKDSLRRGVAFLIPIAGTVVMWVLISDEMNYGARFQYPVLALCALSWYPLVRGISRNLGLPAFVSLSARQKAAVALAVLSLLGFAMRRQIVKSSEITFGPDSRVEMGVLLSRYADRGYTLATTEAGLLPLYSGWRTIDTWGLNDRWIAEHGEVTADYLERQKPDLIMWHGAAVLPDTTPARRGSPWFNQVTTLQRYVQRHGFTLAAVFGTRSDDAHCYYLRSDLPERDEIVTRIRSVLYRR